MREWPLVGREEVLQYLDAVLANPDRRGAVLAGPVGVGKSRLAGEFVLRAERTGLPVVRVTATSAATNIPLGAFASLLPVERSSEPGLVDDRADLLRRCSAALLARRGNGRLILFVDDAHLLDDTSATLVQQFTSDCQAFVVATVRSGEPAPAPVVALWKEEIAERIEVHSLGLDEIAEVLAQALGDPVDDAAVAVLAERTKGNTLFLRELVIGALEDGTLHNEAGVWRLVGELRPSQRLVELVEARLTGLQESERRLVEILAFGEPLGPAELAAVADLGAVDRLERSGLLVSSTDGRRVVVRLAHPLYGDVVRAQVPTLTARAIARALADAVDATGARRREDLLRVASWRMAGGGAEPTMMLTAATAARWRYDFDLAERLARAAVDAGAGFDAELLAAQLAALTGRSAVAATELAKLAGKAVNDEQRAKVALTRLDNRLIYSGTIDEGLRIAEEAEVVLAHTRWGPEVAAQRIVLVLGDKGPGAAADLAANLLANATGPALVRAALPGSWSLARAGRIGAALDAADRAYREHAALATPMDWYPWVHLFNRADALAFSGRLTEALELGLECYQAGVAEGSLEAQAQFTWLLSKSVTDTGDVENAVRRARMATAMNRQLDRPQYVEFTIVVLVLALAMGGRGAEAVEVLAEHDQLDIHSTNFLGVDPLLARGWAAVASGSPEQGAVHFHDAADRGERIGDLAGATNALHALARIGHAKEVALRLDELSTLVEGDLARARAEHTRALAVGDAAGLQAIAARFEEMGANLLCAEAAAEAAVVLLRHGDRRAAAAATNRAALLASRCPGADTPALRSVETRARLTPAEWRCAQLAVAGRSNRAIADELYLAVKTIDNRLQRIYSKLGVSGRAELGEVLATISDAHR
ncbi:AAA family ATPase [Nocardia carnea]|uniref:AAA family ATPase n=1 Tax=Nocardia carnea TaxID=37328 RepID=UPI00245555FD|nr:LuxR family transcriptional regulator [Nocardia carnea]